jgi:16S rRNA processing protein RimM
MAHEPADDQVVVGVVTGAFGLNGDVKVELHTSFSDRFSQGSELFLDGRLVTVQTVRAQKKQLVVKLDAINNRDKAESIGGHFLTIPEKQLQSLPQNQFYHFELLEMSVFTEDDTHLGALSEIITTPGNDVYVVQKDGFRDLLLPALASVVLEVDVSTKRMTVRLLEGLEQTEATIPKRKLKAQRRKAAAIKRAADSATQKTEPN